MNITTLQLHKRSSYTFENIQDKCAIAKDKKAFALADGTTQSYCSERWSAILTNNFAANPEIDIDTLILNFKEAAQEYKDAKFAISTNSAKASLEREKMKQGGTATFIGLFFLSENEVNISSCGDSNLFHLRNQKITAFPFSDKEALDKNKSFLNTAKLLNDNIDKSFFQETKLAYAQGDIIIMATDALSRMFLKAPETLFEFMALKNFEQLHQFCLKNWDARQLEEDDISAIIIHIDGQNALNTIAPPLGFSFPKEEEYVFVPTSLNPPNTSGSNDGFNQKKNYEEMQEIKRELNNLNHKIENMRQVQALQQILMFVTIGLLVIVLVIVYMGMKTKADTTKTAEEIALKVVSIREADLINKFQALKIKADSFKIDVIAMEEAIKKTEAWDVELLNEEFKRVETEVNKLEDSTKTAKGKK